LSNAIANSSLNTLTKSGAGTLTLVSNNTFTGATVSGGTITGGTLTLSSGATALTSNATTAVNSNVNIITAAGTVTSSAGTLTLGGTLDAGSLALTFAGAGNTTVSNAITSATTLTKNDGGTLTLTGANNYAGATLVSGGILIVNNATALGTTAGGTTVSAGASLQLTATSGSIGAEALILNGTGISNGGALRSLGGDKNFAGSITLASSSRINSDNNTWTLTHASGITGVNTDLTMGVTAGTSNVTGAVSLGSGNFTKDGAGTWNLNGANNWTGTTTINAGTLTLGVGTVSVASTIAINGVSTVLQLSGTQVQGINFASNITGTGGLKSGGTVILRGVNGYSGGTTVALSNDQGISFDNDGSLGAGLITFNGSTSYLASVDATAHTLANNVLFSNASSSTGNRFGTWGSSNRGIGNLTLSGPISIVGATPIIGVDGATTTTFSGLVSSTGAFGINKNGTGTLILSNPANSYSGTTTVAAGVLRLDDAGALPGGIGATLGTSALIFNGGVLGLNIATDFNRASGTGVDQVSWTGSALGGFAAHGANRVVNLGGASALLTWNTAGPFGGGGLILGNATAFVVDFQNPIDLNGAVRTVQVDGTTTANAKLSGILSGTGGLNKTGSGALLVSADNTYSGATTIAQGLLKLGATGGATNTPLGTTAGSTTVNANGAALDVNGFTLGTAEPLTLNGTGLSGGGALTNGGAAATYSGPITLASAAYVGSSSGKLTVTGGVSGAFGLTFSGSGDTTVSTTPINANVPLITKLGSPSGAGNLTIDVASTLMMAPISVNAGTFTLSGNGQLGDVAGTVTYTGVNAGRTDQQTLSSATLPAGFNVGSFVMGQMIYNIGGTNTNTSGNPVGFATGVQTFHSGVMALPGGAIAVDNSGTNLNYRFGGNAGTVGRAIGLGGATLTFTPSTTGAVAENLSGLVFMQGHSVITLNADAGFQTDIKAAILNQHGTTTETALIRGSNFGSAAGNGVATLTFTAAPTFIGSTTTGGGTTAQGMLPYVITDITPAGFGTRFATTSGAAQRLRPLAAGEMDAVAFTGGRNILQAGALPAIAADTSINSLTIDSGNVTITNPAFPTAYRTLTISSGGLMATASSTISGGILAGGTPFNVFTPGANAAANVLTISSRVNVSGLVKAGGGTLLLSSVSPAFPGYSQNSFGSYGNHAGNIFLNEGTTKLGAHNALGNTGFTNSSQNDGNSMTLNPGAILDLNGKIQFIGALSSGFSGDNSPTGPLGIGGGNITGSGGAIMLTTGNPGGGPSSFVYAGSVTGSVGFGIVGGTTRQDLTGANSSSGPILIAPTSSRTDLRDYGTMSGFSELSINNGNGLKIDNSLLANINNRLNGSTGTVRFNSGLLDYRGRAQTLSTDAVATVSADTGTSTINIQAGGTNVNSAEFTIGTLTRAAGATLNFSGGTFGQTGTSGQVRAFITNALTGNVALIGAANNQVIPGVVIGGDLASYNSVTGLSTLSYTGGTLNTLGAVSTANYNGSGAVLAGGQTINALKPNGAITFANPGDILTLTSGMIVSANQTYGTTSVRGGLTSATGELILEANTGNLTLNSVVSGANKLVLARGGTYTLTANNLHTGGTTVAGGTLALTNNGLTTPLVVGIPAATVPANGLVLSGGTVTLSNSAGQIDAANIVTLNGGSTLNLMGNNTLAGLVLNNISSTVPVVNTTPSAFGATTNSTDITLTLTGGITSTSNNIASGAGATINGRVSLPSSTTINVGAGTFNGLVLNPWSSDLTIKGLTSGGGTITKSGAGNLRLDVPTVITGTLDVTGGGLLVGAAGAGARFANVVLEDGTNLNLNGFAGTFGSLATGGTGTGIVTNTGGQQTLTVGFSNASTTFAGSFQRRDDSTFNLINLATVGTGTTTLTGNTSTASGTLTLNSTGGGGVKFFDNGVNNFVQGAITVNAGSTLTLDDSGSANLSGRLGNAGVTLSGGTFVSTANAAGSTESTTGALTLNTGESTVTLNQGAVSNVTTFGSLGGLGTGSSATFAGTGIGTATNKLVLTGAPGLTNNILPRLAVGTDFATYNQNGAGVANTNGIQAVTAYSAATN
ncbi:MAG: autotransporter-associated beta strand repeat-containing protein, partial [Chthoniobacter sp.]|nr:autotransporter-associated beta strand repeat-containing protein [Chthoniobacter sp.]